MYHIMYSTCSSCLSLALAFLLSSRARDLEILTSRVRQSQKEKKKLEGTNISHFLFPIHFGGLLGPLLWASGAGFSFGPPPPPIPCSKHAHGMRSSGDGTRTPSSLRGVGILWYNCPCLGVLTRSLFSAPPPPTTPLVGLTSHLHVSTCGSGTW